MDDVTLTKGSKVEVSSDEPGFYGAWYEATLVDIVPLSTKKRRKKKMGYLVEYDTLFAEDNLEEHLGDLVGINKHKSCGLVATETSDVLTDKTQERTTTLTKPRCVPYFYQKESLRKDLN
ncbi:agenet domain-containing protein [Tanacetum coccineum]